MPNGTGFDYQYFLGDNLGNTRVTFGTKTGAAVQIQKDDYYPFGLEINRSVSTPKNEYLYNKKELQEETGLYDYGARFYDPLVARWTTIDPLAEISRRWTPYNYVENNPIRMTDPDGMSATWDDNGNAFLDGAEAQNFARGIQANERKNSKNQDPPGLWQRILSMLGISTKSPRNKEEAQEKANGLERLTKVTESAEKVQNNINNTFGYVPVFSGLYDISKGIVNHNSLQVGLGLGSGLFDIVGGEVINGVSKGFKSLIELGLKDGMTLSASEILTYGEEFLGKGYQELVPGSGRYVSADGTRVVRIGESDITGAHGGGPHANFETLIPNPSKPGKLIVDKNLHIYISH